MSEILVRTMDQDILLSWHPRHSPPPGLPYGSAGICVTQSNEIVLISTDGLRWDMPAGRPEGDETWEETLRREMKEEACALVTNARLLGFCQSRSIRGVEEGVVKVRSIWLAEVVLESWDPRFEISHRKLVAPGDFLESLDIDAGYLPILQNALDEAVLTRRKDAAVTFPNCPDEMSNQHRT